MRFIALNSALTSNYFQFIGLKGKRKKSLINNEHIVRVANQNEALMDGTTVPVSRILSENDLVFACWQDTCAEGGVSTLILKGRRKLLAISFEASPAPLGAVKLQRGSQTLRWSAVKVVDFEMAIAARETLGEAEGWHQ